MKTRRRRRAAWAGALLAGLLGFGLFPQEPLRRWSEARLRAAFGPQARIGGLRVTPFLLRVEAWDVRIVNATLDAHLPRLRLVATPAVLRGDLSSWRALELQSPSLRLRADDQPTTREAAWHGPLRIGRVLVRDGSLVYVGQTHVELRGLSLDGALGERELRARASSARLELPALAAPLEFAPLDAQARVGADLRVHLDRLRLTRAASTLDVAGALGRPGALAPDLRLDGQVALSDPAIPGHDDLAGDVRVTGRVAGGATGLELELTLTAPRVRVAETSFETARARVARQSDGRLVVQAAAGLWGGEARAEASLDGEQLELVAGATGLDARRLKPQTADLAGRAAFELRAHGRWGAPLATQARAQLEGALGGRRVALEARSHGTLDVSGRRVALAWNASAALGDAPQARLRALELHATGRADGVLPPRVSARVDGLAELTLGAPTPAQARFEGHVQAAGRRVTTQLDGHVAGGRFALEAETHATHIARLQARAEGLELGALAAELDGRAGFEVELRGDWPRLHGTGQAHADAVVWRQAALGALDARLSLDDGRPRFELTAPDLAARAEGRLQDGALRGSLELRDTPLQALAASLGRPVEGRLSALAQLDVPLDAPREARVDARIAEFELRAPLEARARGPFELRHAAQRTQIEGLELLGPGATTLSVAGTLGPSPSSATDSPALDVRAQAHLDLARLPLESGARASGEITADVRFSGPLTRPQVEGFIETRGLDVAWPGLPPAALLDTRQALAGDALALRALTLRAAGGQLTLDGRLPWAALLARARRDADRLADDEQARLTLTWDDLDAAELLRARQPDGAAWLQARLGGRAELAGGLLAPHELSGSITLPETALVASDVPVTLAPTTFSLLAGRVSTDALRLAGRDASLELRGALDLASHALDVQSEGALDLRVLSPLLGEASLTGRGELAALVSGPLAAPRVTGTLLTHGAGLRLRALRQPLTDIEAWLTFDDRRLELRELSASLGGGQVTGEGSAQLDGRRLSDVDVRLRGRGVGLYYPVGLRSRLDADLRLSGRSGAFLLAGDVRAERGLFDLDALAEASLFGPSAKPQLSPLLRSFALDLDVASSQPLRVRRTSGALADLLASAQLTLRGDLETPAPYGRVDLVPGGVATLLEHAMVFTSGRLSYEGTWDARLDLHATLDEAIDPSGRKGASANDAYGLLDVGGTLDAPRLTLRGASLPELGPERSLALLANRGDVTLARSGALAAAEQAAALLSGRVSRTLTRGLSPLGLDEITIEPQLVARDTDPGARFTFAKRLTPSARVVYSHSLRNAEDRLVRLDLGPLWRLRASVERAEGGRFAYAAGQTLELGGRARDDARVSGRPRPTDESVRLSAFDFSGDQPLPPDELRAALDLDLGRRVGPWDVLDAAERLRARLVAEGYIEAEVGAWLVDTTARVRISAGPRYDARVSGFVAPRGFTGRLRRALFEDEALERGRQELLRALLRSGHPRARVTTSVETHAEGRTLVFDVQPGPRLRLTSARFPGAAALSSSALLAAAGGLSSVLSDPAAAREAWLAAYRARHYLAARIEAPRIEERDGRLTLEAAIDEGPRARIAELDLVGATLSAEELRQAAGLAPADLYSDARVLSASQRLRERFIGLGHPEARVTAETRERGNDYALLLRVEPGPRVDVAALDVRGATRTDAGLLRGRAGLDVGRPLDVRALAAAESRLLALGTLSAARVTPDPERPGRVLVDVRERAPLALDYRLRRDDDKGLNLQVDGELRHLLHRALVLGGRYRVGRDERDARAFLNVPLAPGPLTLSASRLSEDLPRRAFAGDTVENLRVQRELRAQQAFEVFRPWVLLGGYRFKRVTLLPLQPDPLDVAALSLSLVRETRDNPLDPRSGRFYGVDVELAPAWLASDFTFVKGSAQAFFARSRGTLTWAQGYRLALARGLNGDRLTSTERFKAGGAFTVRGFASDSLGPVFLGAPAGGEALLVLNQELRWRHGSGLGGAVFYDAGNVYARASEVRDLRLRHSLGLGLRYTSPFGLLRVDFGFPLDRRADEKSWRWFFTFGQAF